MLSPKEMIVEVFIDDNKVEDPQVEAATLEETVRSLQTQRCSPGRLMVGMRGYGIDLPGAWLAAAASRVAVPAIGGLPVRCLGLGGVLGFAGFCRGVVRPARELMVRAVVPRGSTGKVFGFVFTGQNAGGSLAPIILGAVMDNLAPQWIFFITIGFMALCIATILAPRAPMAKPGAAE